jgi:hypothetical protein
MQDHGGKVEVHIERQTQVADNMDMSLVLRQEILGRHFQGLEAAPDSTDRCVRALEDEDQVSLFAQNILSRGADRNIESCLGRRIVEEVNWALRRIFVQEHFQGLSVHEWVLW